MDHGHIMYDRTFAVWWTKSPISVASGVSCGIHESSARLLTRLPVMRMKRSRRPRSRILIFSGPRIHPGGQLSTPAEVVRVAV